MKRTLFLSTIALLGLALVAVTIVTASGDEKPQVVNPDAAASCSGKAAVSKQIPLQQSLPDDGLPGNGLLATQVGGCSVPCVDVACTAPACQMDAGTCTNTDLGVRCCDAGGGQELRCSGFETVHKQACDCDAANGPAICPPQGVSHVCQ